MRRTTDERRQPASRIGRILHLFGIGVYGRRGLRDRQAAAIAVVDDPPGRIDAQRATVLALSLGFEVRGSHHLHVEGAREEGEQEHHGEAHEEGQTLVAGPKAQPGHRPATEM